MYYWGGIPASEGGVTGENRRDGSIDLVVIYLAQFTYVQGQKQSPRRCAMLVKSQKKLNS